MSSLYDRALAATGLTITQHALLVNIARADGIGRSALAAHLGMDRTTLTRNLKPLETAKLVMPAESPGRRERLLSLSPKGHRKLQQSYARWEVAQNEFMSKIGPGELRQLREALKLAETAALTSLSEAEKTVPRPKGVS